MLELCLILCFDYIVVSVLVSAFHIVLRMYHGVLRYCRTDDWDLQGAQELCIRRSILYFIYFSTQSIIYLYNLTFIHLIHLLSE
jgi:hypothetical protein